MLNMYPVLKKYFKLNFFRYEEIRFTTKNIYFVAFLKDPTQNTQNN